MADDVLELLAEVSNGFERRLRDLVLEEAPDLLFSHAKLMAFVGRNPGCTQQVLAAAVERDKGQVARLVKELEARRLLAREPHPDNWRAHRLRLTDSGQAYFERLHARRAEIGREIVGSLSISEKESLKQSLKAMLATLRVPGSAPKKIAAS